MDFNTTWRAHSQPTHLWLDTASKYTTLPCRKSSGAAIPWPFLQTDPILTGPSSWRTYPQRHAARNPLACANCQWRR